MGYTTGSAANMDAVKTALVNACVAAGWTPGTDSQSETVLYKGTIYVRIKSTVDGSSNPVFQALGRTGIDTGSAPGVVSMCSIGSTTPPLEVITFPLTYHIFIFSNNEVFMIIGYGGKYQWLAFGQSNQPGLTGTGTWVAATNGSATPTSGIGILAAPSITNNNTSTAAMFWSIYNSQNQAANYWLHNNIDTSYPWSLGYNTNSYTALVGIKYATELINSQPQSMTGESVFIPMRAYKNRASSKCSQVLEITNARHLRIDNYNNEQIITLGTDQWMVFPWYKKNTTTRDGASGGITHTGTFGWAIKYEA